MTIDSMLATKSLISAMADAQAPRVRAHKRGAKADATQSRQEGRN
jgi:hypothetical protein